MEMVALTVGEVEPLGFALAKEVEREVVQHLEEEDLARKLTG
jgi:hypothetical protein